MSEDNQVTPADESNGSLRRGGNMHFRYKHQAENEISTILGSLAADEILKLKLEKKPEYWRLWWEIIIGKP